MTILPTYVEKRTQFFTDFVLVWSPTSTFIQSLHPRQTLNKTIQPDCTSKISHLSTKPDQDSPMEQAKVKLDTFYLPLIPTEF